MLFKSKQSNYSADALLEHIDDLYSYAMGLSRNRNDAEALVQETYVRAFSAFGRLRNGSNTKSWLLIILRNIWLNQARQQQGIVRTAGIDVDRDMPSTTFTDPYTVLMIKIDQEHVRRAIEQLPAEAREIILLREYAELSYQEIATVLDCPIGTVTSRLDRARSKLRILIQDCLECSAVSTNHSSE